MAKTINSPVLEAFVNRLLEEKQLPELDTEVKSQLRQDLLARVEDRINAELITRLTPEQRREFEGLLDGGDDKAIQGFLRNAVPDMETHLAAALTRFRSTYLGIPT